MRWLWFGCRRGQASKTGRTGSLPVGPHGGSAEGIPGLNAALFLMLSRGSRQVLLQRLRPDGIASSLKGDDHGHVGRAHETRAPAHHFHRPHAHAGFPLLRETIPCLACWRQNSGLVRQTLNGMPDDGLVVHPWWAHLLITTFIIPSLAC